MELWIILIHVYGVMDYTYPVYGVMDYTYPVYGVMDYTYPCLWSYGLYLSSLWSYGLYLSMFMELWITLIHVYGVMDYIFNARASSDSALFSSKVHLFLSHETSMDYVSA